MMKRNILIFVFVLLFQTVSSQELLPTDYLSKDFHQNRREALRKIMPKNSVAAFFANPVRNRANDVDYVYHQDPNFYYLTGYKEPHAVLFIFSEGQVEGENSYNEILYVQEKNEQAEMWTGKRLGIEGVHNKLGLNTVYNGSDFKKSIVDFKNFDKVLLIDFKDDYRDSKRNNADLYSLVADFKEKTSFDKSLIPNPIKESLYKMITSTEIKNSANVAQNLGRYLEYYKDLKNDELLVGYQNAASDELRKEFKQKVILKLEATPKTNIDINKLGSLMGSLRETKLPEELKLLKKAIEISAVGQIEIMKAMHPNMSETEIQGVHEFVYKKYGAEYEGYPSIVGGGSNGCILHYIENTKTKVGNDLVLMDLGAEYRGYTADVTRTIPANGTFSTEQKAIYDLVYEAQEAGIAEAKVDAPFNATNAICNKVINEGLVKLGIIKSIDEKHRYFPHGTSHYIGLDVHDTGSYGPFKENMVITVEPGIYIPENSACDKKWWGIAVRIEDDILITKEGPINLSAMAPRKSDEIEKLMQQKSVLDDFKLPKLD
jgi:Xaa-Pro aminopeptidase